jgi:hypothetical protein
MVLGEVAHEGDGDEIQHDRVDDFVGSEPGLQHARDGAPDGAGQHGREETQRQQHPRRTRPQRDPDPGGHERRHVELPFRADIEQAAAERHQHGEAGEDQRRRVKECVADAIGPGERAAKQQRVGLNRVVADHQHQDAADDEGGQDGDQREQKLVHESHQ